jgi:hypothetical protein
VEHSTKRPRPAWFAVPVDAWPDIAAALPRPWPRGAILADLAYWQDLVWTSDGRERRPYRRELVERWGVSDYEARRLMRSVELWADPRKTRPAPVFNHGSTTKSTTNLNHRATDEATEPPDIQPRFNHGSTTNHPHARIDTHTHTQTHKDAREPRGALEGWTEAVDLWRDLGPKTAKGKPKRRRPKQSKGVGKDLARLLRDEGVADVLHVIRWAHESDHERARFLRGARTPRDVPDVANVSLLTLCRAKKFDVYRDFASTWTPRKAQQAPEPSADGSIVPPPLPRRRRHYWAVSND